MKSRNGIRDVPVMELQKRKSSKVGLPSFIPPHNPANPYKFYYDIKGHANLPHVVKFSGGRSSGMLLFVLLENGFLDHSRGDVIVFNNTSAEHPATYKFAAKCKEVAEAEYGIPFFWTEFQTYEDAVGGEYVRIPSYRLVNSKPHSKNNPCGYKSRGEVFEEMLSHLSYIPNQHRRSCTASMKIRATAEFLKDWFTGKEGISRCGHHYETSQMTEASIERLHRKHGGTTPTEILMKKRAYVMSCPPFRPEQAFADFTGAPIRVYNDALTKKGYGRAKLSGSECIEYLSFIGFRADEHPRIRRMHLRNSEDGAAGSAAGNDAPVAGEYMYAPLGKMGVQSDDVGKFWRSQRWGLDLPEDVNMSNCVFCFLKGTGNLLRIADHMSKNPSTGPNGGGPAPADIQWWVKMERKYGRNLKQENRVVKNADAWNGEEPIIGFFGTNPKVSFGRLAKLAEEEKVPAQAGFESLPCNCTD